MTKDEIIKYQLINEKARYEAFKALSVAFKHIAITLLLCITLIACAYMYFVVPVEDDIVTVTNGSQLIDSSSIGGNNGM